MSSTSSCDVRQRGDATARAPRVASRSHEARERHDARAHERAVAGAAACPSRASALRCSDEPPPSSAGWRSRPIACGTEHRRRSGSRCPGRRSVHAKEELGDAVVHRIAARRLLGEQRGAMHSAISVSSLHSPGPNTPLPFISARSSRGIGGLNSYGTPRASPHACASSTPAARSSCAPFSEIHPSCVTPLRMLS